MNDRFDRFRQGREGLQAARAQGMFTGNQGRGFAQNDDFARIYAGDGYGSTPEELNQQGYAYDQGLGWMDPFQRSNNANQELMGRYGAPSAPPPFQQAQPQMQPGMPQGMPQKPGMGMAPSKPYPDTQAPMGGMQIGGEPAGGMGGGGMPGGPMGGGGMGGGIGNPYVMPGGGLLGYRSNVHFGTYDPTQMGGQNPYYRPPTTSPQQALGKRGLL